MAEHSNTLVTVKSNSSLHTETDSQTNSTEEETSEKVLQISESTSKDIPVNLLTIIEKLEELSKSDLLICVLYVLMIETGFIPYQFKDEFKDNNVDFHMDRVDFFSFLPKNWKNDQSYKIQFILSPFPDKICKLFCVVSSQNLHANLLINTQDKFCVRLPLCRYILNENILPIPRKFMHLKELSIKFKNQVALPAKSSILSNEGVSHASLQDLPTEIIYTIFVKLKAVDFIHLKSSCKRMQACAKYFEHELWEMYFKRDFPDVNSGPDQKWAERYKTEFTVRCLRRKREMQREIHRFSDPFFQLI